MLTAADTNVFLDLAWNEDSVVDAIATIRQRLPQARLIAPPTVLHELAFTARRGQSASLRSAALRALSLLRQWGFEPLNLVPVGHGIVERIAAAIRGEGLLPAEEFNDSLIIAEASVLGCRILVSSDAHMRDVDFKRLTLILQNFDVAAPILATPREIVRKFFH